jgi:uncharacterized membrane protein YfcA
MHGEAIPQGLNVMSMLLNIDMHTAMWLIMLGFMGGVLSGFIGSGGAFIMTPGMMNLGVPGIMAVSANITHKFGKAMVGQKKHGEFGHVDRKLGLFMCISSFLGIQLAVMVNKQIFASSGASGSDLYISLFFVSFLSIIGTLMLLDCRSRGDCAKDAGPSKGLYNFFQRFQFPPVIKFKTAGVSVSFWILSICGLLTGYLAGTIGVGGFIGVPAMIYIFGVPTAVAAGTELFLAMFMGAYGAFNYAWAGYVDLRLALLLYLGSLIGLMIGTVGTKLVKEIYIRLVTAVIILLCVSSRAVAIPGYLTKLGYMHMNESTVATLKMVSTILLFGSGIVATGMILVVAIGSHLKRLRKVNLIPGLEYERL